MVDKHITIKKLEMGISKKFFTIVITIGILITLLGFIFFAIVYVFAPNYSFNPQYKGFWMLTNHPDKSEQFHSQHLTIEVSVSENPELYFDYYYGLEANDTFNFVFLFPFKIINNIDSTTGMNFSETPYGTAVWVSRQFEDVGINGKGDHIHGLFDIENSFQSGTLGDYAYQLPITSEYRRTDIVDDLKTELNLNYQISQVKINLIFSLPSSVKITNFYPQPAGRDFFSFGESNQTINVVEWSINGTHTLQQQFIIFGEDNEEYTFYQYFVFVSGILISIGSSLIVRGIYDYFKQKQKIASSEVTHDKIKNSNITQEDKKKT